MHLVVIEHPLTTKADVPYVEKALILSLVLTKKVTVGFF